MSAPQPQSGLAPGLSRKVKKILDLKTEQHDLVGALATLSTFFEDNTPAARRGLRSTIERRGLQIHETFLTSASEAIQALDAVQSHLDGLSHSCRSISEVLASTKQATGPLLSDMERLQRDLDGVAQRGTMINEFLDQYQLAPEEVDALQGEEVGPPFFSALSRVRQIHENCRLLLRTHHQRAGLELMDLMSTYQETAYERLCRWVQGECRSIGDFDAPEVDEALQAAVGALRERPVLFKYCAEEVATARHNALFQRFITALTRGGPGGVPRPIEIHAHDPKRYINDMLAWVHQALAGEREFIVALFGGEAGVDGKQSDEFQEGEDGMSTASLLDRIFESICRPLKVRIEQVLMTSPPLLLCFQLAQLHAFYLNLVQKVVGQGAGLSVALRGCRDMATRVFHEQLRGRGDKLLRSPPQPPQDLSPPQQIQETLKQLLEILAASESTMEASPSPTSPSSPTSTLQGGDELGPVLAAVLDPLVEACERSAEALTPDAPSRVDENSRLDPAARGIYLINCLGSMVSTLARHKNAHPRVQQLSEAIEGHVSALVGGEVGRLLARCKMAEVLERMRLYKQPGGTAGGSAPSVLPPSSPGGEGTFSSSPASDPDLSLAKVAEAMRSFFILVSSPDTLPEFRAIQAPRTRADTSARLARSLADAYELLYNAVVNDPTSGYGEGAASAIRHTPTQVQTILGAL